MSRRWEASRLLGRGFRPVKFYLRSPAYLEDWLARVCVKWLLRLGSARVPVYFPFPVSRRSGVAAREPPLHLVSCKGVLRCLSSVVTVCSLLSGVSQVCSSVFVCRFGGPVLGACSLGLTFGFGSSMAFVSSLALGCFLLARLQSWPSLKNLPVVYVAKNHRWVASGVLSSVVSCVWFDVLFCISR